MIILTIRELDLNFTLTLRLITFFFLIPLVQWLWVSFVIIILHVWPFIIYWLV